ncbi:MAG: hypothetical protein JWM10_4640 [Myxococcaceae bacterium]|nr:hypothetical protein [Myxococcaceae bacterium]
MTRRWGLPLALFARAAVALADPPPPTLPAVPWTSIDPIAVGGVGVHAPLLLPDGRVAVFTRSPATLALVDPATGSVRASPLEEPPAECTRDHCVAPRLDASGRLVYLGVGGTLFRLGLDGRVRVAAQLADSQLDVVVRPDGTEVAVVSRQTSVESAHVVFVALRADGSVAATRSFGASAIPPPVSLGDEVAIGVPRGVAVFDRAGTARLVPSVDGLLHLVNTAGGVLAVTQSSVFPLDAAGVATAPHPLLGPVHDWVSSNVGPAVARLDGSPPGFLLVDRAGNQRRVDAAAAFETASLDGAGALLLATPRGRLAALNADGSPRWELILGARAIVPRVTLGPGGDAWVTSLDGDLLHLWSPPPSAQEAPRAHR